MVHLAAPAGDFFMNVAADTPVSLDFRWRRPDADVSDARYAGERTAYRAGELVPRGGESMTFACASCRSSERACRTLPRFTAHTGYREPTSRPIAPNASSDSEGLRFKETGSRNQRSGNAVHLCGPVGLCSLPQNNWVSLGVNNENIHYECFRPA